MTLPVSLIAKELSIQQWQVDNTIELLNQKATVPFISRYRKERTGNLDEVQVSNIQSMYEKLEELAKRKESILATIEELGKLTDELRERISNSWDAQEIEDIYLPFKPRRKTKADKAIEQGLEPLAKILMSQKGGDIYQIAGRFVKGELNSAEEAVEGAMHIAALWVSERESVRRRLRNLFSRSAYVQAKLVKGKEEEGEKYKDYFDYQELAKRIKSHRFLAVYRGQKEGILKVGIAPDRKEALELISSVVIKNHGDFSEEMESVVKDAYSRLLKPSLETELKNEIKEKSDEEAIKVFAENLRQLLLQPPLGNKRILAIDPGFRTGCKVVCINENGDLLSNITIYPNPPQKETSQAMKKVSTLVEQHKIEAIAIGNGTASRETENFIKRIRFDRKVQVFIVNEAGASIYSASKVAREEFPQYDVTVRGAVSIGRRLMDPLAELVKIDAKSIGVGQYQHDVDQSLLKKKLDAVVESCVNKVGVDLNTASKYLLTYVSGIGPQIASNIVDYRSENGNFTSRKQLEKVPKLGAKAFEQSAGFLRVAEGDNPLDNSAVHPENYKLLDSILKDQKVELSDLIGDEKGINQINWSSYQKEEVGELTLNDIKEELLKPGRDPRKAAKVFEFAKGIHKLEDLKIGMELPGIINNVTNFGAFVDVGIKENGLIHISNLADGYVSNPADIVSLHQHVNVEVISIDADRKRIGLSLIK